MRTISLLIILAVFCHIANAQDDILPQDTATRVGTLPNGLTYYLRYNNKPDNEACFYIAQKVGCMQEEDNQKGLAHFLEHMAFNGTKHFPGKRLTEMLSENGITFNNGIEATTLFDRTIYCINHVPTNKNPWLMDSCLIILSDWSHGLTLDDKEIDNERGVIQSEWRFRTDAATRMLVRALPKLYPDSKYADRTPLGSMEIIENFPYDDLKKYYNTWYYPHNQGIIIVGDINVDDMEEKIKKYFGVIETPADAPKAQKYPVPDNEKPIFVCEKDKEQNDEIIELMFKYDEMAPEFKNTVSFFAICKALHTIIFATYKRLEEIFQKPDAPFSNAGVGTEAYKVSNTKKALRISLAIKEGKAKESLKTLFREMLRIKKFGFTESELERAKTEIMSSMELFYNNRFNIDNSIYTTRCLTNFFDNEPMMSIDLEYQYLAHVLQYFNAENINNIVQQIITDNGRNMVCYAVQREKPGAQYITEEDMEDAFNQAINEDITPYEDNVKTEPLFSRQLKGGTITKETEGPFGSKTWILDNGIKVVVKQTKCLIDEIVFEAIRLGGESILEMDANNKCNINLFPHMIRQQGLGNFTANELSKLLTGKKCSMEPYVSYREHGFSGRTCNKDFETMLQLLYMYFTDVNANENDYNSFMAQQKFAIQNRSANPQSALDEALQRTVYDNNIRMQALQLSDLDKADLQAMMGYYKKLFGNPASFTYNFIGDFDENQLKALVCKYLGSFKKKKETPSYVKGRTDLHQGNKDTVCTIKMETPQSMIEDYLHSIVPYSTKNYLLSQITAHILSSIFFDEIREKRSITYAVEAIPNYGAYDEKDKAFDIMCFVCPVKPGHEQEAQNIMYETLKVISENGADEGLLNKAKELCTKKHSTELNSNDYWANTICGKNLYGVDRHSDYFETLQNITMDDIKNYCKKLYGEYSHINAVMKPE